MFTNPVASPAKANESRGPINILDGILSSAMKHHREGRLSEAELIYRRILEIEPRHAKALCMLGTLALEVGRLDVAVQLVGAALCIDDKRPAYHCQFGRVLYAQGKIDKAAAAYKRALKLDATDIEAKTLLKELQDGEGKAPGGPGCQAREPMSFRVVR